MLISVTYRTNLSISLRINSMSKSTSDTLSLISTLQNENVCLQELDVDLESSGDVLILSPVSRKDSGIYQCLPLETHSYPEVKGEMQLTVHCEDRSLRYTPEKQIFKTHLSRAQTELEIWLHHTQNLQRFSTFTVRKKAES